MNFEQKSIVLVGKLGHGKTRIINKLCGTHHASNMGTGSCTRSLQWGYTKENNIFVIDTPGLCAREDPAAHLAGVKEALEGVELSGVYVVIKWGRADDIAEILDPILDFIGDDDVRVIITHADTVCNEPGFDEEEVKKSLSKQFDLPFAHFIVIGRDTSPNVLENFVKETMHEPKFYEIGDEQIAAISCRTAGHRSANKPINAIVGKLEAATKMCHDIISQGQGKSYETDVFIISLQHTATTMVGEGKEGIFRDASNLTEDQQNLVYGKAGLALSLKLKAFIETTNKYLTWDVTDVTNPRNSYRKCPHCGAVFNKVEGCDGATICGAVPSNKKLLSSPNVNFDFQDDSKERSGYRVVLWMNGIVIQVSECITELQKKLQWNTTSSGSNHTRLLTSEIETGCGAQIVWSSMIPVEPERVKELGVVETYKPQSYEKASKNNFKKNLAKHQARNKDALNKIFKSKKK